MDISIVITLMSACVSVGVYLSTIKTQGKQLDSLENKVDTRIETYDNKFSVINERLALAENDIERAHNRINALKDDLKEKGVL